MKWLPAIVGILFSFGAVAADLQPLKQPEAPPKYMIVNGKKFFMLNNARRYTGGNGLSPSALGVMHHPRPATSGPIITRGTASSSPSYNGIHNPNASASPASPTDVLSVFAPEEKTPSAATITK